MGEFLEQKMGSKICLIFGLLAILVALTTAAENADTRLSEAEETASLRVARFAEAGGKRQARRRKIRKENKKAKKESKLKKRRNRKNNKISKSSKKKTPIDREIAYIFRLIRCFGHVIFHLFN